MKKKKLAQLPKRLKKVIPCHFEKRKKATLSEIIQAGASRVRIKEVLQNNKALATALEESQSSNARMRQEYALAVTKVSMARRKLKDMASNIQNMVADLDATLNYLDFSQLTSSKIYFNDDLKIGTCPPDLETIVESPVASNKDELMVDASPVITQLEMVEKSTIDTSATEIYNVTNFITNSDKQNDSQERNVSSPLLTPVLPQFSPIKYSSKMLDFVFEKPKDLEREEFTRQTTSKAKTNSNLSKIPVRRPNLFCNPGIPDSPEAQVPSIRRETFVVNQLENDNNDSLPVSAKPRTVTLPEIAHQVADSDRRGTFAVPRPVKPFQLPHEIFTDDVTLNSVVDMELTEIITPAALASATYEMQFNNFSVSSNKAPPTISTPPTVNTRSPEYCHESDGQSVSPILPEKLLKQQKLLIDPVIEVESDLNVISEHKKSNRASRKSVLPYPKRFSKQMNQTNDASDLEKVHGCQRSETSKITELPNLLKESLNRRNLSSDHDLSEETDFKAIDKQNKSSRASRKSLLPNPKELLNQLNLSDNIDVPDTARAKTTNGVMSLDEITKPSSVYSTEKTVVNREHSNEPEVSENSSNSSFSDILPSDSEPEFIATEQQRKRIPGRRSLKPGRRGPFIFKKTRKSNSKLNKLECASSKGYDFSLSDEDEEPTTTQKQGKKPPKKSSKISKNENTIAILERDIGIMYQEQGRRKRSLKKKVSFVNIIVTPTNSDGEDRVKNSEREIQILDGMLETNDCEKRDVPVRRSILKKPSLPGEKIYISHEISPDIEHKLKSSFSCTDESEQSEEFKKNEKSEDIEKQTNKAKERSQRDDLVNVADKKMDGQPEEHLFATSHVDEKNFSKKSSLNVNQGNSSSKLSRSKSHKNSEFLGFESERSKSKRAFSGISERSSKKIVTTTDDFLDDVDVPFPEVNPNDRASDIKSLSNATQNTHTSLAKPPIDHVNVEDATAKSKTSDSKKSSKAKGNKKNKTPISKDVLSEVKENARKCTSKNVIKESIDSAFTPPPSKARKTNSAGSLKENLFVPELEGRSRRSRPTVSLKEPSLNRKMRRD